MMPELIDYEVDIQRVAVRGKRNMQMQAAVKSILPLQILAHQILVLKGASEIDMAFIDNVVKLGDCIDYNILNNSLARSKRESPQTRSMDVYQPLIDMKPTDPDTMMIAMIRVQQL